MSHHLFWHECPLWHLLLQLTSAFLQRHLLLLHSLLQLHILPEADPALWSLAASLIDILSGVEVCSGEIRSIRHPILSKIGSSGLGMNGSRIIRMTPSDDIGLIGWSTDDRIDRIDQIIWSNPVYFDNFFFKLNFFF